MKFSCNIQWHCRKGGGLFLGLKYDFPCAIENEGLYHLFQIGLLVFSIRLILIY